GQPEPARFPWRTTEWSGAARGITSVWSVRLPHGGALFRVEKPALVRLHQRVGRVRGAVVPDRAPTGPGQLDRLPDPGRRRARPVGGEPGGGGGGGARADDPGPAVAAAPGAGAVRGRARGQAIPGM